MLRAAVILFALALASPVWAVNTITVFDDTTTPVQDFTDRFATWTCIDSDGTDIVDGAEQTLIDSSAITNQSFTGIAVTRIMGYASDPIMELRFEYSATTDDVIAIIGGANLANGFFDLRFPYNGLVAPESTGGTCPTACDVDLEVINIDNTENVCVYVEVRLIP